MTRAGLVGTGGISKTYFMKMFEFELWDSNLCTYEDGAKTLRLTLACKTAIGV
ncbi:MAG: hypothetical protein HN368_22100 [Spirochaetales bacterium]|jgi:hypothetical protein|nr:hypothetical protein [Spirochaetales bacterium]